MGSRSRMATWGSLIRWLRRSTGSTYWGGGPTRAPLRVRWAPTPALAPSMGSNAVLAAKQAKVKHIVRNSAIKAGHDAPNRNGRLHALVEESVKASGIAWTILRPHYYMQN